jgi:hypothetical protein
MAHVRTGVFPAGRSGILSLLNASPDITDGTEPKRWRPLPHVFDSELLLTDLLAQLPMSWILCHGKPGHSISA